MRVLHNPISRKGIAGIAIVATVIGGIIVAILKDVASGVIGNAAYNLLPSVWEVAIRSIQANTWPWIITLVTILLGLSGMLYLWQQARLLKSALDATDQMVKLDSSMLRQLSSSVTSSDLNDEMHRLLGQLLQNATEAFPEDAYKAAILLPDANQEYLRMSASYQMSAESKNRTKFYIGKDENRKSERGTAGLTYLDEKVRVGHIIRKKNGWEWSAEGYIYFGNQRPYPSHYSFISIPITSTDPSAPTGKPECVGVVCFDSHSAKTFDTLRIQKFLQTFVLRIAAVLTLFAQLSGKP
jgi:hypothetical protein